jgi:competence protein CoiA
MKFADVEEGRREATQSGQSAKCPVCRGAVIAKCGNVRVWHWAHERTGTCDFEREPETKWHRDWKNKFPPDWQECIRLKDGKKYIADVMTKRGMIIEFQHSYLHQEVREGRESFYQKMIWVVDGQRRKRDRARFFASLGAAPVVKFKPLTCLFPSNAGALLRDWAASRVPVFFDFGDLSEPGDPLFDKPILWRLNPGTSKGRAHLSPVLKSSFLNAYLNGQPLKGMDCSAAAGPLLLLLQQPQQAQHAPQFQLATDFQRYRLGRSVHESVSNRPLRERA